MKLYEPQTIKLIKNKYGFRFSKSLGQNFLIDKDVIDAIVEGADISEEDLVIEIGPGIGVLTQAAAERAGRVVCVEIDRNLIEIMKFTLSGLTNVKVINDNILKTDLNKIIENEKGDLKHVKVLGNLPYYITTPIIMKLLEEQVPCESITVMMQREVADRIVSGPGSKAYGAVSVAVQYYADVTRVVEADKTSFMPQPKVDSSVLRLDVRTEPAVKVKDEKQYFNVVRAAFSQKRKTLLNSLGSLGLSKQTTGEILEEAGIDSRRRAETLSLEDFARIAEALEKTNSNN